MGRKHKHEEHENLERWLVSYADFITLLFAVFVVLYALGQLDLAKFKDFKVSLAEAFRPSILQGKEGIQDSDGETVLKMEPDQTSLVPPLMDNLAVQKEQEDFEEAAEKLNPEDGSKALEGVSAKVDKRGLVISLLDKVLFESGSAVMNESGKGTLNTVALIIKDKFQYHRIRVEGHTDSLPISSVQFPSNWELSSARSASVIRFFTEKHNLPKNSFAAVGYSDSIPIESNSTEAGRARNRRVEIVILHQNLTNSEPAKSLVKDKAIKKKAAVKSKIVDDEPIVIRSEDNHKSKQLKYIDAKDSEPPVKQVQKNETKNHDSTIPNDKNNESKNSQSSKNEQQKENTIVNPKVLKHEPLMNP